MKFELSPYQRYYLLLTYLKNKSYSKFTHVGMHYHHIKPKSIFGENNNLIICCPPDFHARLHFHIWKFYEQIGDFESTQKMKYAYNQLIKKFKIQFIPEKYTLIDERYLWKKNDIKTYKYLMYTYNIDTRKTSTK